MGAAIAAGNQEKKGKWALLVNKPIKQKNNKILLIFFSKKKSKMALI